MYMVWWKWNDLVGKSDWFWEYILSGNVTVIVIVDKCSWDVICYIISHGGHESLEISGVDDLTKVLIIKVYKLM